MSAEEKQRDYALVGRTLGQLIHASPGGMAAVDAELRYLDFNAVFAAQIATACGSVPQAGVSVLGHVPAFHEPLERALAGNAFVLDDGRGLEWSCTPMGETLLLAVRDISEIARLKAEATQLASKVAHVDRLNQDTFERSAIGLANVSLDGRYLRVNRAFCEIVGRAEGEMLTLAFTDITHPEDLQADFVQSGRLRSGEISSYTTEKRYIRPDGSCVWVSLASSLVNEHGFPSYFITSVKDITAIVVARRRSEAAHERLRMALRSAHGALWGWNPLTGRAEWSPEFQDLFGLPADQPPSHERWLACLVPEDQAEKQRRIAEALATPGLDRVSTEFRFHHPRFGLRWAMCLASIRRNHAGVGVWLEGIVLDITELRHAEFRLREAENRFNLAMLRGQTVAVALDLDLRHTWLHSSLTELNAEWAIGKTPYDVFEPDSAACLATIYREVMQSRSGVRRDVALIRRNSAVEQHFDMIAEPSFDLAGRVSGVLCVAFDITERVRHLRALEEARAEAERADRAKTRFLAAVSHDLRQPVQGMRLLLHVLARKVIEPSQVMICARMGETLSSTEQMLSRLMELGAAEAGKVNIQHEPVALERLIQRLVEGSMVEAAERGLALRARTFPLRIMSDPVLLERILRNLLGNAISYTRQGGVLIGMRRRGGRVCIEVWDTGIGIPADKREFIFEEFYQLANPERDRNKGIGLGLAIASRTSELLGFRLYMASRPGRGSVFGLELGEACQIAGLPEVQRVIAGRDGDRQARVLIIEDDPVQSLALQILLEDSGYAVMTAGNSEQALERTLAAKCVPDVILSDYRLPGALTGLELIAVLRTRLDRFIPAVLITGDALAGIAEHGEVEDCAVLRKPYLPDELLKMLREIETDGLLPASAC
ncbi:MAG: PAS domain S-box protein [Zoogloea sp.]|nr:PAS domain S-box protein [Zoogloea sp.]